MASEALKAAFRTDVEPILATAHVEKGAAIASVAAYRAGHAASSGTSLVTICRTDRHRATLAGICK
jgi:L-rhamnose isomerase